jgi:uncharacterized protein YukE
MQAIANPDELVNFANALEHYLNTLEQETSRLTSGFNQLGDSWRDQKRMEFEEIYHNLLGSLAAFKENANQQIPHLRIMAEDLRQYLSR